MDISPNISRQMWQMLTTTLLEIAETWKESHHPQGILYILDEL